MDVKIEAKDIRIDTFCSSGPRAVVNTTYSACVLLIFRLTLVFAQDGEVAIKNRKGSACCVRAL